MTMKQGGFRCGECDEEHHDLLDMEPAFRSPDFLLSLSPDLRRLRVRETPDLCLYFGPNNAARAFVRALLPVVITDREKPTTWGVWVEVADSDIPEDEAAAARTESMPGTLANRIPGYRDTTTLRGTLFELRDKHLRPRFELDEADHPFAAECRAGVTTHQFSQWMRAILGQ